MPAKIGDKLPSVQLDEIVNGDITKVDISELFKGKKGVLFGVPGAFTPGCSKTHLPGYVENYDKLKAAGAEVVACVAVNDVFVQDAWGREHKAEGKVRMLADPRAELAKALDIELDLTDLLGSKRLTRFSAVIEDGVIKTFNLEEGGALACSLAPDIIKQLQQFFRLTDEEPPLFDVMRRHWGF